MKFKPGTLVMLTGQHSVWMTVNNSFGEGETEQTVCLWFDTKNRLQRHSFLTSLLELAPIWVTTPLTNTAAGGQK